MHAGRQTASLPRPSGAALWIAGVGALWLLYGLVFWQTVPEPVGLAVIDATANVLPLAGLSFITRAILISHVMHRPVGLQAISHLGLALAFATTWYALVLVGLALAEGLQGQGWNVDGFSRRAFTWQVFQGLVIYATVAATCYAIRGGRETANVTILASAPLDRYLTKTGDEIRPVDVRDIIAIVGAQDYAEVTTHKGRHLVRMSLSEFERRLDANRFVRIHRSTIVNMDHFERAEPAGGGRLLAHLSNGDVVAVSRAGAQTLREMIV